VVACGDAASRLVPGQRVAIEPGFPCRRCHPCRTGRYNLCPDIRFLATPPVDGALTKFLAVPEDFAHPVPDHLSDQAAALIEPLSVAVWACQKGAVGLGDHVMITGAGPIGVLCALVAAASGARPTVVEISPERRSRARALGLEVVTGPDDLGSSPHNFHQLIECSGSPGALTSALPAVAPDGQVVLVGMSPTNDLTLPLSVVQTRELTVTGTFRYANTYPTAIALAAAGRVPLDRLVDITFPLEQVAEALTATARNPSLLKAVVQP
ncbi:MAG: zinc-binding dehydrogenase, partial [Acidimicrobiales bacterium]